MTPQINPDEIIYKVSKRVYEKEISKNDGVNRLVDDLKMNKGSALIIVGQVFPNVLSGSSM